MLNIYPLWVGMCSKGLIAQLNPWVSGHRASCFTLVSCLYVTQLLLFRFKVVLFLEIFVVSFSVIMGCPSKCPGCKVLKSVHGKNCPGPAHAEDETANASVPGSVVDIEEDLAPSELPNNAHWLNMLLATPKFYSPKILVRWKGQNDSSVWCL